MSCRETPRPLRTFSLPLLEILTHDRGRTISLLSLEKQKDRGRGRRPAHLLPDRKLHVDPIQGDPERRREKDLSDGKEVKLSRIENQRKVEEEIRGTWCSGSSHFSQLEKKKTKEEMKKTLWRRRKSIICDFRDEQRKMRKKNTDESSTLFTKSSTHPANSRRIKKAALLPPSFRYSPSLPPPPRFLILYLFLLFQDFEACVCQQQ